MNNTCEKCGAENFNHAKYCCGCGCELPKPAIEDAPLTTTKPEKENNRNKSTIALIVLAISVISLFITQQLSFKSSSVDKKFAKIASEINEICPMMVDSETRLDNTVAIPPKTFQYNYTLVNLDKEFIDTIEVKASLEPNIVNWLRTDPAMQFARDKKATVNYRYRDKMGNYVFMISVTPEQYK